MLTVTDSYFTDNYASIGGALYNNFDVMTLDDDTFLDNSGLWSEAIDNFAGGTVIVNDSTFVGNSSQDGGAIKNESGTVEVTSSTFYDNTATPGGSGSGTGGAIDNEDGLTLNNSIVAGNIAAIGPDIYGSISTDNGFNLLGTALQGTTFGAGDVFSDTPLFGPLQNNGGSTPTLALLSGSPADGAGDPGQAGTIAQNDIIRPATPDIGAFQPAALVVTNTNDSGPARAARVIEEADTIGGAISFAISTSDSGFVLASDSFTIQILSALPTIGNSVTIDGTTEWGYLQTTYAITVSTPDIVLDGTSAGSGVNGLTIAGSGSTIVGLVIDNFNGNGITVEGAGTIVEGNYIGTNAAGTAALGNGGDGVDRQ